MNLTGLDILVLKDDVMLGKRTAALLERLGAEVSVAPSVQAARTLIAAMAFDIALLDVNLPDGLGTDLLREKRFGLDTTVVVVTAHGGSGLGLAISKQLANQLGAELALRTSSASGCLFTLRLPGGLFQGEPTTSRRSNMEQTMTE